MVKMTPWFPGNVKPVRPGVYERKPRPGYYRFSFWNGRKWMCSAKSVGGAVINRRYRNSHAQREPWRGLAEDPKA